jgi:hypothetical protein
MARVRKACVVQTSLTKIERFPVVYVRYYCSGYLKKYADAVVLKIYNKYLKKKNSRFQI